MMQILLHFFKPIIKCREDLSLGVLILNFNSNKYKIVISNESVTLDTQAEISELMYSIAETCTFSIDRNLIGKEFELSIKTKIPDGEVFYPRQGYFPIKV